MFRLVILCGLLALVLVGCGSPPKAPQPAARTPADDQDTERVQVVRVVRQALLAIDQADAQAFCDSIDPRSQQQVIEVGRLQDRSQSLSCARAAKIYLRQARKEARPGALRQAAARLDRAVVEIKPPYATVVVLGGKQTITVVQTELGWRLQLLSGAS